MVGSWQIEELPAGDYMVLSIADEGEGMDEKTLQKAATPFFTTKAIGKGTGLGLPMIQGIDGAARRRLGEGRERSFGCRSPSGRRPPFASATGRRVGAAFGASLTVLTVDGDTLVRMNTVLMLDDLGHVAIKAQSGKDALESLKTDWFRTWSSRIRRCRR